LGNKKWGEKPPKKGQATKSESFSRGALMGFASSLKKSAQNLVFIPWNSFPKLLRRYKFVYHLNKSGED